MQPANQKKRSDAPNALGRGIHGPSLNDRRSSQRLAVHLQIEVCGESPFNPQAFRGRTRDIAANGIYFVCEEASMAGQLVHVTIRLSGDMVAGSDSVFLTLRYRIQRVEEIFQNGAKTFGIAVALDE
jgi:hypothetical protein